MNGSYFMDDVLYERCISLLMDEAESRLTPGEQGRWFIKRRRITVQKPSENAEDDALFARMMIILFGERLGTIFTYNDTCAICMDKFHGFSDTLITQCNHVYHRGCLLACMQHKQQCPCCQQSISITEVQWIR
jgi:hypothetical protein